MIITATNRLNKTDRNGQAGTSHITHNISAIIPRLLFYLTEWLLVGLLTTTTAEISLTRKFQNESRFIKHPMHIEHAFPIVVKISIIE